ncbi:unnamed protein product [Rhizoctonia solani]|uniref:Yeast cell wall synthesis Kre9/Knh1-like N-terminal domain-containing protein n=1 Tax=Rhizoctonia solani TaxID=456999 RepID=A0A8H3E468_9AGAM|nr:unnamed protein product [Rhizoctonia solani]
MLFVLFVFLISIIYVRAFDITHPDSSGWPTNVGMMTVRWNTSPPDPPTFTMLLLDASISSVVNPLAVAANVPSAAGSFQLDLPTVPVSQTYQILFVDPTDLSRIFATSSIFPITNSPNTTLSATITQTTLTTILTLPPPSSTIPTASLSASNVPSTTSPISTASITSINSINSITSSTASTSSTLASLTQFTTSTLGTPITVTVTVSNPGASFVPINAAGPKSVGNWAGPFVVIVVSFYLGAL